MKQLEEIQKAEEQLIKIKQELEIVQKKLDKNITRQIEQKERKRKIAFLEVNEIKRVFVSPITDNPVVYMKGYSHLMKKELWNHNYEYQQMWYTFTEEFKKIPSIVELNKRIDRLNGEIEKLRDTGDYNNLSEKINCLERDQRFKERTIENLKDIGQFRQYAKDVKVTKERREKESTITERKKKFQEKIEKEYLPMMKKSVVDYIK